MSAVSLGAVILNYKTAGDAVSLAQHISEMPLVDRVCIVDNDPCGEDALIIREWVHRFRCEKVSVIEATKNLGYSGGNNLGIDDLRMARCTHALVLNPDVTISEEDVELLLGEIVSGRSDLVSPRVLEGDSKAAVEYRAWITFAGTDLRVRSGERRKFVAFLERIGLAIPHFSGACFVASIDTLDRLGGFPERLFLYCEEVWLSAELMRCGLRQSIVSDVVVGHAVGASIGSHDDIKSRSRVNLSSASESAVAVTRRYWPWALPAVLCARLVLAVRVSLSRGARDGGLIVAGAARGLRVR